MATGLTHLSILGLLKWFERRIMALEPLHIFAAWRRKRVISHKHTKQSDFFFKPMKLPTFRIWERKSVYGTCSNIYIVGYMAATAVFLHCITPPQPFYVRSITSKQNKTKNNFDYPQIRSSHCSQTYTRWYTSGEKIWLDTVGTPQPGHTAEENSRLLKKMHHLHSLIIHISPAGHK